MIQMTYDQLVTFDAIVKHGSFKAASEVLHKTQPSLSMAIKKLEDEFGIKLFSRDEYRPSLTDEGKAFHLKTLNALDKFQELETFAKEMAMGSEPEINISIDAICPLNKISSIFEKFLSPEISTALNLDVDILDEQYQKVLYGDVDFAIGHYIGQDISIEAIPILKVSMIPVIASKFYQDTDGSFDNLTTYPQIIVKSSAKASTKKVYGAAKGMRQWFTTDMSMKEQLILNGLGWGRLPHHQVEKQITTGELSEVININTIYPIEIEICLVRNTKKVMGPNTKMLWNYLLDIAEL